MHPLQTTRIASGLALTSRLVGLKPAQYFPPSLTNLKLKYRQQLRINAPPLFNIRVVRGDVPTTVGGAYFRISAFFCSIAILVSNPAAEYQHLP